MTSYEKPTTNAAAGKYSGFAWIEFVVSNAKQVADWYCLRLGFKHVAYKGLETGSRHSASHVVQQNRIKLVFTSPLLPTDKTLAQRIAVTGDAAKDVAFKCDNVRGIYEKAIKRGAVSVRAPEDLKDDNGSVTIATVRTYGDTDHTFVQFNDYKGPFLPGYQAVKDVDPLSALVGCPELDFIDHVVGNQPDMKMEETAKWYETCLDFHRFWSVDDKQVHTQYSALRSIVMTDFHETVKMPINEPAKGLKKSQIQEYVDYHGGAGVQHIALNTKDILKAMGILRARGLEFLRVPDTYYKDLRIRLSKSSVEIKEDLDEIQKLGILVDFDDKGYLLQIFTKPVEDRPTLFYEVIQRANHSGFGAGNFKSLFEAIEAEQGRRGNL